MTFTVSPVNNANVRAKQFVFSNGTRVLLSYDTLVLAEKNGKVYRLWDGYSRTTQKHIAEFLGYFLRKDDLRKLESSTLKKLVGKKMASTVEFGLYCSKGCKYSDIDNTECLF